MRGLGLYKIICQLYNKKIKYAPSSHNGPPTLKTTAWDNKTPNLIFLSTIPVLGGFTSILEELTFLIQANFDTFITAEAKKST